MSRWLYNYTTDKRNGKEFTYNSMIHENDLLLVGFSYREIMDEVIANYGHNVTEKGNSWAGKRTSWNGKGKHGRKFDVVYWQYACRN